MVPLLAFQLPLALLVLIACYAALQRYLGVDARFGDVLIGVVVAGASTLITSHVTRLLGLGFVPRHSLQNIKLGLSSAIPLVGLDALAIWWLAKPRGARAAGSGLGLGLAIANVVLLALTGAAIRPSDFFGVLLILAPTLLAVLIPATLSLGLALGRDRGRLPVYAVLGVVLLTFNFWLDGTILPGAAFIVYEILAVLVSTGLLALVLRAFGPSGSTPATRVDESL